MATRCCNAPTEVVASYHQVLEAKAKTGVEEEASKFISKWIIDTKSDLNSHDAQAS